MHLCRSNLFGEGPLKTEQGEVTAALPLLLLLTGQLNQGHDARCDPVGPSKRWQGRSGDVGAVLRVLAFGRVCTPAEKLQSHCARLALHFSQ